MTDDHRMTLVDNLLYEVEGVVSQTLGFSLVCLKSHTLVATIL